MSEATEGAHPGSALQNCLSFPLGSGSLMHLCVQRGRPVWAQLRQLWALLRAPGHQFTAQDWPGTQCFTRLAPLETGHCP